MSLQFTPLTAEQLFDRDHFSFTLRVNIAAGPRGKPDEHQQRRDEPFKRPQLSGSIGVLFVISLQFPCASSF